MISIGAGHAVMEKLCGYLNMSEPMTQHNYDKPSTTIKNAAEVVTDGSVKDAAEEVKCGIYVADVGVSLDGSWQRRGFSSIPCR